MSCETGSDASDDHAGGRRSLGARAEGTPAPRIVPSDADVTQKSERAETGAEGRA